MIYTIDFSVVCDDLIRLHSTCPILYLSLVEDDYVWVTEKLKDVAARYAKGRIVSILEGGYALRALGRSVLMHIKSLSDV